SEGADTVRHSFAIVLSLWVTTLQAWAEPRVNGAQKHSQPVDARPIVLKPARVWDGLSNVAETGWIVVVRGKTIEAAGPADRVKVPGEAHSVEIPNSTLIPGLIDLHTHILLHPYNEALWNDQVLKEALALRVCRATNHLRSTLLSGFTTIRDLGTEG